MAMTINTNIPSLNAQRNLAGTQTVVQTALQRLSSGLRVNSAKDDAAGIAIASTLDAQARGMAQALRNANDGISMVQTAEGALSTMGDILQRMRELAVQGANNGTDDATIGGNLDAEYQELNLELTRITDATKFNGISLINGDYSSISFQVGANDQAEDQIAVTFADATAYVASGDVQSQSGSVDEITAMDASITLLAADRALIGAALNRLQFAATNLQTSYENTKAGYGRIMDADFAVETANLTRGQVLQQAGTAMLAQANSAPQGVLALMKNL